MTASAREHVVRHFDSARIIPHYEAYYRRVLGDAASFRE